MANDIYENIEDEEDFKDHVLQKIDNRILSDFEKLASPGLNNEVTILVPTNGCIDWLPIFLEEFNSMNLSPVYLCECQTNDGTIEYLRENNIEYHIKPEHLPHGILEQSIRYAAECVNTDWLFRLDDDEFPTPALVNWINKITYDKSVHVWHIKRLELAIMNGELNSILPKWGEQNFEDVNYYSQYQRLYQPKEVIYTKPKIHSNGFVAKNHGLAPADATFVHLDCIVRSPIERFKKLQSYDNVRKNAGWTFSNHYVPEFESDIFQNRIKYSQVNIDRMVGKLLEQRPHTQENITLSIEDIRKIQSDLNVRLYGDYLAGLNRTTLNYAIPWRCPMSSPIFQCH